MKKTKTIKQNWYLVDAQDQILGRLASQIASVLIGKHRPDYDPSKNWLDFLVVINAEKIKTTGQKEKNKIYYRHSGYLGNLKTQTLADLRKKNPTQIIKRAVWNMLPKNKLRQRRFKRMKVFVGPEHSFQNRKLVKIFN